MRATQLVKGEHYAEKRGRFGAAIEVELLSTEPHRWDRTSRSFVPGRGVRSDTYLVRRANGPDGSYVVQSREIVSTWADYLTKRAESEERHRLERLAHEEQLRQAAEVNGPKLAHLLRAAKAAGCSPGFVDALENQPATRPTLREYISLDDLVALAKVRA